MLKQFNAESGYAEMDALAPDLVDEILDHAMIDDDVVLAEIEPWDFPDDEDDPE